MWGHKNVVELKELMGEANVAYMQNDKAITLLKEFIKKAPTVPDPYRTLGVIYEKRMDRAKAVQFFLIACTPQVLLLHILHITD